MTRTRHYLSSLSDYVSAIADRVEACVDCLEETPGLDDVEAVLRFHHLRLDGNGRPKVRELAECLVDHIDFYCFSAIRRDATLSDNEGSARSVAQNRLAREARALLRKAPCGGEAGELLLFMLVESVIGAPQLVAKMDLKQNPKLEVHGSDGIHALWNERDDCLELYFGESKLERSATDAVRHAFDSIRAFYDADVDQHEVRLVTSHFKYADPRLRRELVQCLDPHSPSSNHRINHAILIGYDWDGYANASGTSLSELRESVRNAYIEDVPRLTAAVRRGHEKCEITLRTEVFFVPFDAVETFRQVFLEAAQ